MSLPSNLIQLQKPVDGLNHAYNKEDGSIWQLTNGTWAKATNQKQDFLKKAYAQEIKNLPSAVENIPDSFKLPIGNGKPQATPQGGDTKVLRYPVSPPITNDSDYVVFGFYKYAPPFGGGRDTQTPADPNSPSKTTNAPWGYSNYQDSNERSYKNKSLDPIILYMPEDIQTQFGAGWNGAGFGAAAAGMLGVAGSINTQKDWGAVTQAAIGSVPGSIKSSVFSALVKGINEFAGANITTNQALGSVTGTIINPNVELLYEAPKLRNFSLKFKLVPRSNKEALEIKKICNRFKKAMLPSFGGQAFFGAVQEAANLLTIPDLCQVSFMKGNSFHPYLPKYKLCGITDVSINYTAAGAYATYSDGSPVATELTISFLESKLIFSQEIEEDGSGI
jgi:hypothetical protein